MLSFTHQQWCSNLVMHTSKTQTRHFPSAETVKIITIERGESLPIYIQCNHLYIMFSQWEDLKICLDHSKVNERFVIRHIQTAHALIYVCQTQQSPSFQNHIWGERNCAQDSLFGQGVSYSSWEAANRKNILGSCHHALLLLHPVALVLTSRDKMLPALTPTCGSGECLSYFLTFLHAFTCVLGNAIQTCC